MKRLHYKSVGTYIFMKLGNVGARSYCLRPHDYYDLHVLVRDSLHEMYALASLHHKYIFQRTAREITLLCGFDHFSTSQDHFALVMEGTGEIVGLIPSSKYGRRHGGHVFISEGLLSITAARADAWWRTQVWRLAGH